jgi:Zn-dependent protease
VNDSLSLGRIAGIRVGLNWSVLALAGILVWQLAAVVFPDTNPGLGGGTHLAMAVAAAVLFLLSILLHELGHALQARRDGLAIDGITLWLFGGVARFGGQFPGPGAEFRIAIAGPVVSLLLALAFGGASFVGALPEAVAVVCWWTGQINAVLLVFNMLPGLPLDGGRVLRAILWRATGDIRRGTEVATVVARVVASLMIGGGLALALLTGSALSGVWLALIGWILLRASGEEVRSARVQGTLAEHAVAELMLPAEAVVTAPLHGGLPEFLESTRWRGPFSSYPVTDGERVVGVLPYAALAAVAPGRLHLGRVADLTLPLEGLVVLSPAERLDRAVDRMESAATERALVLDDGRLAGLLSLEDVRRMLRSSPALRGDR